MLRTLNALASAVMAVMFVCCIAAWATDGKEHSWFERAVILGVVLVVNIVSTLLMYADAPKK